MVIIMEKDVNPELLMKLPLWTHDKMIYLHKFKTGRVVEYKAIMKPIDFDPIPEDVTFCAHGIREFEKQIRLYKHGGKRKGIHY